MLLASLLTLSVLVVPATAPAAPDEGEVRFAQDDLEDLPPPPPPPPIDDSGEAAPPPSLEDAPDSERRPSRAKEPAGDDTDDEADEDGEPGFIDKYFPLALESDLHPAADEVLWSFWMFPFLGSIWLPVALTKEDAPEDYVIEAIITWAVHMVPHLALAACSVGGMFVPFCFIFIPYIGPLLALPIIFANFGCACVNVLTMVGNYGYCLPVALANAFSRGAREAELGGGEDVLLLPPRNDALASAAMPY